ncbi:MAG TPA: FG-GAP-like repeat-containing protein, partial [Fibrella sp.]
DVADINNDALPDIMQLDMLPETNIRLKTMLVGQDYDRKQMSIAPPYNQQLQYMRNSLQLNLGSIGPDQTPRFSEIGLLAGVARTDWSWSALLADYDNDGHKDLYITNGYRKNVTDRDFISYTEEFSGFGTTEAVAQKRRELMNKIPEVPLPHYAYKNTGDLSFTDVSAQWGLNQTSFANGAAYADLDNDGDLDLVVNNIDAPAFVYRNQTQEMLKPHYLTIHLRGNVPNRQGIGAGVTIWSGGQMQYAEQSVVRGYLSSVDAGLHIGLGRHSRIDSLQITWPGGATEKRYNIRPDQTLTLVQATAKRRLEQSKPVQNPLFNDITDKLKLTFAHRESEFVDFKQTAALHKMLSRSGFALTTGDVNGDSLADIFIGGAYRGSPPSLLIQRADGGFTEKKLAASGEHDDTSALLFDADGDRDLDLYVVSGGNEVAATNTSFYQHRLYLNNGRGDFLPASSTALPNVSGSGSCVVAADFDHDKDLDLFVGGRQIPGMYPLPARSYLLRNDGGRFVDVTAQVCPALMKAGLVCGALWSDYNGDGWADLILAGEWMPITMFTNQRGQQLMPADNGLKTATGWWNNLVAGDFDGDGDTDYVVGN